MDCPTRFHIIHSITVDESSFPLSKKNIIEHQFGLNIVTSDVKNNSINKKNSWIYKWENAIKICHVDEFETLIKEHNLRGKKLTKDNLMKLKEALKKEFNLY